MAVDLARVSIQSLPRLQRNFTAGLRSGIESASRTEMIVRRLWDASMVTTMLALPVIVFVGGHYPEPLTQATWLAALVADGAWMIYLLTRPRRWKDTDGR